MVHCLTGRTYLVGSSSGQFWSRLLISLVINETIGMETMLINFADDIKMGGVASTLEARLESGYGSHYYNILSQRG